MYKAGSDCFLRTASFHSFFEASSKWLHPMTNIETRKKSSPSSEMNLYPHDSYSYVLSITCPRPFASKLHLLRVFQTNVRDGERKKRGTSKLCSLSKVLIHRLQKFHSVTRQLFSRFKKKRLTKAIKRVHDHTSRRHCLAHTDPQE